MFKVNVKKLDGEEREAGGGSAWVFLLDYSCTKLQIYQ